MKNQNWLEKEARKEAIRVLDLDDVTTEGGELFADEEAQVAAIADAIERTARSFGNRIAYGPEPNDGRMFAGMNHVDIALGEWER